jgi:hypothetical protein
VGVNQRDATVIVIDFVRQQGPDEPSLLRALKVLERRADVLRLRNERRNAMRSKRVNDCHPGRADGEEPSHVQIAAAHFGVVRFTLSLRISGES